MEKFKLPRLEKKKLKKQFWLYPADEKGNSLMAQPHKIKKDYDAMKAGIVKNLMERKSPEEKAKRKQEYEKLNEEIYLSDEELRTYVDDIFHKDYRNSSFNILIEAKNHKKGKKGYFHFINAYQKHLQDGSFGNICCMSVDLAKDLMKSTKPKRKKKKRYNS